MIETLKKYWWAFLLGLVAIYFLFFNKKGKTYRRRATMRARTSYGGMRSRMRSRRMTRRRR